VALAARLKAAPFQDWIGNVLKGRGLSRAIPWGKSTAALQFAEKHDPSTSAAKASRRERLYRSVETLRYPKSLFFSKLFSR
jgi:hypothetical protein